jgi:hypothetical protein
MKHRAFAIIAAFAVAASVVFKLAVGGPWRVALLFGVSMAMVGCYALAGWIWPEEE